MDSSTELGRPTFLRLRIQRFGPGDGYTSMGEEVIDIVSPRCTVPGHDGFEKTVLVRGQFLGSDRASFRYILKMQEKPDLETGIADGQVISPALAFLRDGGHGLGFPGLRISIHA
jgi:hypothetical protein